MIAQHASNSVRVRFLPIIRSRMHKDLVPKIDDLDPNRRSISDISLMTERNWTGAGMCLCVLSVRRGCSVQF